MAPAPSEGRALIRLAAPIALPAAARRGIGSAIMLRVERDAAEHCVHALHLTVTLSGIALYEKLGYRRSWPERSNFRTERASAA
ncbi:GNAT family N-acetyltransferase [Chelativorans xinjiangense]|uniref:GNAT family N-acetyltransferase n=1 Tax=Chelativorans xinjiangense TaxID=2681485 RepID=UPI00135C4F02|nr:GNAT family N-acetyltransferase [Chelativorans xinjiangense]